MVPEIIASHFLAQIPLLGLKTRQSHRRRIGAQHNSPERRSPQGIFLEFLKFIVGKNSACNRDVSLNPRLPPTYCLFSCTFLLKPPPPGLSDNSTLSGLYFALLGTLESYLTASHRTASQFPPCFFFDNYLDELDLTRYSGAFLNSQWWPHNFSFLQAWRIDGSPKKTLSGQPG